MSRASEPQATTYAAVVGQVLARARTERGLSQAALADGLGVVQSVVSRVESGALPLTVDFLARWAALVQLRPGEVLDRAGVAATTLKRRGVRVLLQRPKEGSADGALIGAAAVGALMALAFAKNNKN